MSGLAGVWRFDTEPDAAVFFDGRLDNRPELLAALPQEVSPAAPDAELVLAAWRQWGDGCFARLCGDFAVALFDPGARALLLARDPVGCRPLYYWRDRQRLVFGSEIKTILAQPGVTTAPNEDLLADSFLLDQLPYEDEGETFFDGISAVLPGSRVRVDAGRTLSTKYWDFDPGAQIRCGTYAEYSERLRVLLVQAVKRRLRSAHPIAVATSGGLDSSAVLCLADDLRRSGDATSAIVPLGCRTSDDPASEENRFIAAVEQRRGLQVTRVRMSPPGDLARLARVTCQTESPQFDDGWCALSPLLETARASGARVLLTGMWSDQLFFSTAYLVDLFRQPAWRLIARHLEEYPRWFVDADAAYFRARFRRELAHAVTPARLRSVLRPFRTAAAARGISNVPATWVHRVRRRRPRVRHPRFATAHARHVYQTVRAKAHRLQVEADAKIAARYGLAHVTPFLDRDVIAYVMSIPGEIVNRDGVPRALLRDALRGIVPDAVLERRWRNDGAALAQIRRRAYVASHQSLHACAALGFVPCGLSVDGPDSLPYIALEFWSRQFICGTL